jgi:hypothetical protein
MPRNALQTSDDDGNALARAPYGWGGGAAALGGQGQQQ